MIGNVLQEILELQMSYEVKVAGHGCMYSGVRQEHHDILHQKVWKQAQTS
jgi:hypothetical protein